MGKIRRRDPAPIQDGMYEAIVTVLRKGYAEKHDPAQVKAQRKIRTNELALKKVTCPITNEMQETVVCDGRIIIRRSQIATIVNHYRRYSKGQGAKKIYESIKRKYCGLARPTIQDIINSDPIQKKIIPSFKNKAKLKTIQSSEPMGRLQMDLVDVKGIGNLDVSVYRYVLSILDVHSRYLWLYPLKKKDSKDVARSIQENIEAYGPPRKIQTDRGGEFRKAVVRLCQENGIQHIRSRAKHPQSQGKVCGQSNVITLMGMKVVKMFKITHNQRWRMRMLISWRPQL